MKIPFNIPYTSGNEHALILDSIERGQYSAGGYYNKKVERKLEDITLAHKVLATSSCTHALEMSAILLDIQPGDEIIMSSFNFVSAANAFVLRGAKIVFVDIRPDTLNIDENLIEVAITINTKAILVMHYGGVACEMDTIKSISEKYNLPIIEDAAHCIGSYYKGKHLGTIGDLGTFSFHATKNIHCGEGGALVINNSKYVDRALVVREKGTNRQAFVNGKVDKYTWVDIGSSFLLSEISAAFLLAQLSKIDEVLDKRARLYSKYISSFGGYETPESNKHLYYIYSKKRDALIAYCHKKKIQCFFHYVPLHSSPFGKKNSIFVGQDRVTTKKSKELVRLPLYFDLSFNAQDTIINTVLNFMNSNS